MADFNTNYLVSVELASMKGLLELQKELKQLQALANKKEMTIDVKLKLDSTDLEAQVQKIVKGAVKKAGGGTGGGSSGSSGGESSAVVTALATAARQVSEAAGKLAAVAGDLRRGGGGTGGPTPAAAESAYTGSERRASERLARVKSEQVDSGAGLASAEAKQTRATTEVTAQYAKLDVALAEATNAARNQKALFEARAKKRALPADRLNAQTADVVREAQALAASDKQLMRAGQTLEEAILEEATVRGQFLRALAIQFRLQAEQQAATKGLTESERNLAAANNEAATQTRSRTRRAAPAATPASGTASADHIDPINLKGIESSFDRLEDLLRRNVIAPLEHLASLDLSGLVSKLEALGAVSFDANGQQTLLRNFAAQAQAQAQGPPERRQRQGPLPAGGDQRRNSYDYNASPSDVRLAESVSQRQSRIDEERKAQERAARDAQREADARARRTHLVGNLIGREGEAAVAVRRASLKRRGSAYIIPERLTPEELASTRHSRPELERRIGKYADVLASGTLSPERRAEAQERLARTHTLLAAQEGLNARIEKSRKQTVLGQDYRRANQAIQEGKETLRDAQPKSGVGPTRNTHGRYDLSLPDDGLAAPEDVQARRRLAARAREYARGLAPGRKAVRKASAAEEALRRVLEPVTTARIPKREKSPEEEALEKRIPSSVTDALALHRSAFASPGPFERERVPDKIFRGADGKLRSAPADSPTFVGLQKVPAESPGVRLRKKIFDAAVAGRYNYSDELEARVRRITFDADAGRNARKQDLFLKQAKEGQLQKFAKEYAAQGGTPEDFFATEAIPGASLGNVSGIKDTQGQLHPARYVNRTAAGAAGRRKNLLAQGEPALPQERLAAIVAAIQRGEEPDYTGIGPRKRAQIEEYLSASNRDRSTTEVTTRVRPDGGSSLSDLAGSLAHGATGGKAPDLRRALSAVTADKLANGDEEALKAVAALGAIHDKSIEATLAAEAKAVEATGRTQTGAEIEASRRKLEDAAQKRIERQLGLPAGRFHIVGAPPVDPSTYSDSYVSPDIVAADGTRRSRESGAGTSQGRQIRNRQNYEAARRILEKGALAPVTTEGVLDPETDIRGPSFTRDEILPGARVSSVTEQYNLRNTAQKGFAVTEDVLAGFTDPTKGGGNIGRIQRGLAGKRSGDARAKLIDDIKEFQKINTDPIIEEKLADLRAVSKGLSTLKKRAGKAKAGGEAKKRLDGEVAVLERRIRDAQDAVFTATEDRLPRSKDKAAATLPDLHKLIAGSHPAFKEELKPLLKIAETSEGPQRIAALQDISRIFSGVAKAAGEEVAFIESVRDDEKSLGWQPGGRTFRPTRAFAERALNRTAEGRALKGDEREKALDTHEIAQIQDLLKEKGFLLQNQKGGKNEQAAIRSYLQGRREDRENLGDRVQLNRPGDNTFDASVRLDQLQNYFHPELLTNLDPEAAGVQHFRQLFAQAQAGLSGATPGTPPATAAVLGDLIGAAEAGRTAGGPIPGMTPTVLAALQNAARSSGTPPGATPPPGTGFYSPTLGIYGPAAPPPPPPPVVPPVTTGGSGGSGGDDPDGSKKRAADEKAAKEAEKAAKKAADETAARQKEAEVARLQEEQRRRVASATAGLGTVPAVPEELARSLTKELDKSLGSIITSQGQVRKANIGLAAAKGSTVPGEYEKALSSAATAAKRFDVVQTDFLTQLESALSQAPEHFAQFGPRLQAVKDITKQRRGIEEELNVVNKGLADPNLSESARSAQTAEQTRLNALLKQTRQEEGRIRQTLEAEVGARNRATKAEEKRLSVTRQLSNQAKRLALFVPAAGFVYGLYGQLTQAFSASVQLEASLARLQGIVNRQGPIFQEQLRAESFGLAKDYGTDVGRSVSTLQTFAQAGFEGTDLFSAARAALEGEVGAGLEAGQAQELLIAIHNITDGTIKFGDILDRVSRIEAKYAVTAQDLAVAVQRVGAIAKELQPQRLGNVDFADFIIGAVTRIVETTRVTGNQAATGLKFILTRLASPRVSGRLQKEFGIDLASNQAGTTLRPLTDILGDVAAKYQSLTASGDTIKAQRLLYTLGGTRQAVVTAGLLVDFNKVMQVAVESSRSFGDTQRRVALQMDTLQAKIGQLRSVFTEWIDSLLSKSGVISILKDTIDGIRNTPVVGTVAGNVPGASLLAGGVASVALGKVGILLQTFFKAQQRASAIAAPGTAAFFSGLRLTASALTGFVLKLGFIGLAVGGVLTAFQLLSLATRRQAEEKERFGFKTSEELRPTLEKTAAFIEFARLASEQKQTRRDFISYVEEASKTAQQEVAVDLKLTPEQKTRLFQVDEKGAYTNPKAYNLLRTALRESFKGLAGFDRLADNAAKDEYISNVLRNTALVVGGTQFTQASELRGQLEAFITDIQDTVGKTAEKVARTYENGGVYSARSALFFDETLGGARRGAQALGRAPALPGQAQFGIIGRFVSSILGPDEASIGFDYTRDIRKGRRGEIRGDVTNFLDSGFGGVLKGLGRVAFQGATLADVFTNLIDDGSTLGQAFDEVAERFLIFTGTRLEAVTAAEKKFEDSKLSTRGGSGQLLTERQTAVFGELGGPKSETALAYRQQQLVFNSIRKSVLDRYDAQGRLKDAGLDTTQATTSGGNTGLAVVFDQVSLALEEVALRIEKTRKATAAEQTSAALTRSENRERFRSAIQEAGRGTLIRDKLLELLLASSTARASAETTYTSFQRTGLTFDREQALANSSQALLEGLSKLIPTLQSDLAKVTDSLLRASVSGALADAAAAVAGETEGRGSIGTLTISQAVAESKKLTGTDAVLVSPEQLKALESAQEQVQGALEAISSNRTFFSTLDDESRATILRGLNVPLSDLDITFRKINELAERMVKYDLDVLDARKEGARLEAGRLDRLVAVAAFQDQRASLFRAGQGRIAELRGPVASLGTRLGLSKQEFAQTQSRIEFTRQVARQQALNDALATKQQPNNRELLQKYRDIDVKAASDQYKLQLDEQLQAIQLVQTTWVDAQIQAVNAIQAVIDRGTSGFRDVLSSYEALGLRTKDFWANLGGKIFTPIEQALGASLADNIQQALFGQDGVLRDVAGDLFGGSERIKLAQQEATIIYNAHVNGITAGFAEANAVASGSSGLPGGGGLPGGPETITSEDIATFAKSLSRPSEDLPAALGDFQKVLLRAPGKFNPGTFGAAGLLGAGGAAAVGGFAAFGSAGVGTYVDSEAAQAAIIAKANSDAIGVQVAQLPPLFGPSFNPPVFGSSGTGGGTTAALDSNRLPVFGSGIGLPTIPEQDKAKTDEEKAAAAKAKRKALLAYGAQLVGSYGGAYLGEAIHGKNTYSSTGSSIGTAVGTLVGGPVGSIVGGLLGGVLGGLFKKKTPKDPKEYTALDRIERNTRETVTAITNQTALLSLDNRLLNVPASFKVPQYRPTISGGGEVGTIAGATVQITINDARDPQAVAKAVAQELSTGLRTQGTYVSVR